MAGASPRGPPRLPLPSGWPGRPWPMARVRSQAGGRRGRPFLGRPGQAERELAALAADAAGRSRSGWRCSLRQLLLRHGRQPTRRSTTCCAIGDPCGATNCFPGASSHGLWPGAAVPVQADGVAQRRARTLSLHAVVGDGLDRRGRLEEALELLSPGPRRRDAVGRPVRREKWASPRSADMPVRLRGPTRWSRSRPSPRPGPWTSIIRPPNSEATSPAARCLAPGARPCGRAPSARPPVRRHLQELGRGLFPTALRRRRQALTLTGVTTRAAETLAELDALGLPANRVNEIDLLQARAWAAHPPETSPAPRQARSRGRPRPRDRRPDRRHEGAARPGPAGPGPPGGRPAGRPGR